MSDKMAGDGNLDNSVASPPQQDNFDRSELYGSFASQSKPETSLDSQGATGGRLEFNTAALYGSADTGSAKTSPMGDTVSGAPREQTDFTPGASSPNKDAGAITDAGKDSGLSPDAGKEITTPQAGQDTYTSQNTTKDAGDITDAGKDPGLSSDTDKSQDLVNENDSVGLPPTAETTTHGKPEAHLSSEATTTAGPNSDAIPPREQQPTHMAGVQQEREGDAGALSQPDQKSEIAASGHSAITSQNAATEQPLGEKSLSTADVNTPAGAGNPAADQRIAPADGSYSNARARAFEAWSGQPPKEAMPASPEANINAAKPEQSEPLEQPTLPVNSNSATGEAAKPQEYKTPREQTFEAWQGNPPIEKEAKVDTPQQNAEAQSTPEAQARELLEKASKVEPQVTEKLQSAAGQSGGEMLGLEHRLKSPDSLARKIEDGTKPEKISDALRYTMSFPPEQYTQGVQQVRSDLMANGYQENKVANTFGDGNPYQGINNSYEKEGQVFELQFHTPETFAIKSGENHKLYEASRELFTKDERGIEQPKPQDQVQAALAKHSETLENYPELAKIAKSFTDKFSMPEKIATAVNDFRDMITAQQAANYNNIVRPTDVDQIKSHRRNK